MSRPSRRFQGSRMSEALVPLILVVLLIGLLAVLVILGLTLMGVIPG